MQLEKMRGNRNERPPIEMNLSTSAVKLKERTSRRKKNTEINTRTFSFGRGSFEGQVRITSTCKRHARDYERSELVRKRTNGIKRQSEAV